MTEPDNPPIQTIEVRCCVCGGTLRVDPHYTNAKAVKHPGCVPVGR